MDKKKILLVSLGHLSCDINAGALPAALPYARAAYNLDYQAAGGLIFAYSCLSSIIQPFFGLLADKHNKPWFIPLGIVLAGFGISLIGFVSNYWVIFAGIAISGIGSSFFHPEAARFANRVSGKSKGAGISLFSIGGNGGFIIGPLIVTAAVGWFGLYGMSVFAIIALIMGLIVFLSIVRMQPDTASISPTGSLKQAKFAAGDPQGAEGDEIAATVKEKEPENNWHEFIKLVMIIIPRAIVFTGCNTFIPLYWVSVFDQSKAAGATALVIFGACGVACNMLGGLLTDRFGNVRVIRIAFTFMAPVVLLFGLIDNLYLAYALLPCLGCVLYMPFSAQVVLGQKLLARNVGFASGVTMGLATTLGGIAQPCLGALADAMGLRSVFICLTCCAIPGVIFAYLLSKTAVKN